MAEVKKELEGCAIYATMLSKDKGMMGGYERCMAEFGVGYGPGGQVRAKRSGGGRCEWQSRKEGHSDKKKGVDCVLLQ